MNLQKLEYFFFIENFNSINMDKIDGIHITSNNKSRIQSIRNKIDIIGTAHNQLEYYIKKNQGCSRIFLSPLFFTDKYSGNKILKVNKFNLISKSWGQKIMALGGIREKNLNQLKILKISGIGSITLFK